MEESGSECDAIPKRLVESESQGDSVSDSNSESDVISETSSNKGDPMFVDKSLPEGWKRKLVQRQAGASAGKWDVYIVSPFGRQFRSRNELKNYFETNHMNLDADSFDLSVYGKGKGNTVNGSQKKKETPGKKQKTPATSIANQQSSGNTTRVLKSDAGKMPNDSTPTVAMSGAKDSSSKQNLEPGANASKLKAIASDSDSDTTSDSSWSEGDSKKGKKAKPVKRKKKPNAKSVETSRPPAETRPKRVQKKSPYFEETEANPPKQIKLAEKSKWIPPKSPYGLIQEKLYDDPWKLLVATILLHKTKGKNACPLTEKFVKKWPSPDAIVEADINEIAEFIKTLGLHQKRARIIKRFSEEYKTKQWKYPIELYGIGKYGNDSYRMFCVNEWRYVEPSDYMLNFYHSWISTNQSALGLS